MKKPENLKQHPYYVGVLERQLLLHKEKMECLQKRLVLIDTDKSTKSEFQKNEDQLTKIKTFTELESVKKMVAEREGYYIQFLKDFLANIEEMENNYANIVRQAKASDSSEVAMVLGKMEFDTNVGADNIEGRLHWYKKLKNLLK